MADQFRKDRFSVASLALNHCADQIVQDGLRMANQRVELCDQLAIAFGSHGDKTYKLVNERDFPVPGECRRVAVAACDN